MKAAYFMKHGGPEVMQYGDVPDPVAGPGLVLVDVYAASVNGADWKVRAGHYAAITNVPYVPGRDFSGASLLIMSVSIRPGATAFTRICFGASSFAAESVIPMTAALLPA